MQRTQLTTVGGGGGTGGGFGMPDWASAGFARPVPLARQPAVPPSTGVQSARASAVASSAVITSVAPTTAPASPFARPAAPCQACSGLVFWRDLRHLLHCTRCDEPKSIADVRAVVAALRDCVGGAGRENHRPIPQAQACAAPASAGTAADGGHGGPAEASGPTTAATAPWSDARRWVRLNVPLNVVDATLHIEEPRDEAEASDRERLRWCGVWWVEWVANEGARLERVEGLEVTEGPRGRTVGLRLRPLYRPTHWRLGSVVDFLAE